MYLFTHNSNRKEKSQAQNNIKDGTSTTCSFERTIRLKLFHQHLTPFKKTHKYQQNYKMKECFEYLNQPIGVCHLK